MVTDPWKEVHAAKKAASAYVEHELSMHLHHNKPLQCTTTTHMNDETDHVLSSLARGQKPDLKQLMARMTWRRRIPQPISGHGWSSTITKTKPSATITSVSSV